MMRGLGVHAGLLVVSAALAVYPWARDKKVAAAAGADVTVWPGRADEVQRIAFESKGKRVTLDAKSDAVGRYFAGSQVAMAPSAADAGAGAAAKTVAFVSVTAGQKVVDGLAPFKAIRDLGNVDGEREHELGLDKPEGTLEVDIGGKAYNLIVGAATPGGSDRYVRDAASGRAYAARGDFFRTLESGDASLTERELHGFKDADVQEVRVAARGKERRLVRHGPDSKRIWADPSDPEKADETATNWLAKLDRLKPIEYPSDPKPEPILRLDYTVKGAPPAFLELAKAQTADKPDYLARTERTRQWAKVPTTIAEQVAQDLPTILQTF